MMAQHAAGVEMSNANCGRLQVPRSAAAPRVDLDGWGSRFSLTMLALVICYLQCSCWPPLTGSECARFDLEKAAQPPSDRPHGVQSHLETLMVSISGGV